MISLFTNLDIQFIVFFIDFYFNKNEIEILANLCTKNKFLSFFLKDIKNIWIKRKYFIETDHKMIIKHKYDFIKHIYINNYFFLNNLYDNKNYSIIFHYVNRNDIFNNTDLYPGYTNFYGKCNLCEYFAGTFDREMLFKIHKNINEKEYLKIVEIFEYFKQNIENKYTLSRKIKFVFNSDYISLNTSSSNNTKIFDKNGILMNFVNWYEKIKTIKNICIADFSMTPYVYVSVNLTLYVLKFHIDTIRIK